MALETEDLDLDSEIVRQGVQAVFDDPNRGEYWVAEREGEVVGGLLTLPEWSDWRNGTVLWIHSVYVVPEERGKGVFRAMFETLKRLVASSTDLRGLRLYVDRSNGNAQKVYEQLGMDGDHYKVYEWFPS